MITTLGAAIGPSKTGNIEFDVMTPMTDVELPVFQELVLDDGGTKFGDMQLALTVVPGIDPDGESSEGSELGDVEGGCNAGGGSGG